MNRSRIGTLLALAAVVGWASAAAALVVVGGDKTKYDCYAGFEVEGTSNPSTAALKGKKKVEQRECGGSCTFDVQVCLNEPVTGCTPSPVQSFAKGDAQYQVPGLPATTTDHVCSNTVTVTVPKKKTSTLKFIAVGADGKKDKDTLKLQCKNNKQQTGCGITPAECSPNPQGGPDTLVVTVKGTGSDLDNGWTGVSHNFPTPSDSKIFYCLSGCDGTAANPVCTATGATGAGTDNTATFGPPLPLVAGGVPVCVINRFATPTVTSTGNLLTGETNGTIQLNSDVFVSDATRVCPRCENGTCDSGANRDAACQVDGEVVVVNSLATNKNFRLSKQCPPGGNPVSTLNITLPITTGTVTTPGTGGSKPCREREAQGVPVKDNDCSGPCNCGPGACQVGSDVCQEMVPNPSNPSEMICKDIKGGLTQCCCSNNPSLSCHPTEAGGIGIVRTGLPVAPVPLVPDPTYPKVADNAVVVSTFCEAATGNANIDTVSGLPGPGALIITVQGVFDKLPTP